MVKRRHIDIITMGCSKNLVDSELLMGKLASRGYSVAHDPENPSGEYVVVNTCGFIGDAKEESVNMILELAELKKQKKIGRLVVMGCLSQRYLPELQKLIPEVDIWYGKFDWKGFIDLLPPIEKDSTAPTQRIITSAPWSAYLKISEGCDRFCAFCAIPYITGRHKSRPMEEIVDEARRLVQNGVKELNVIAQDLSSYGIDLYGSQKLPELIDRLADIEGLEWIRLHYLYPADFPTGILDVIQKRDNVCKYIDIALQHIADPVLANMNRKISREETLRLLDEIREKVPGIHIRTTLMTGFPGEGDEEYDQLLQFVEDQRFERMGAFAYSEEEGTLGAKNFKDGIPQDEKQERLDRLMEIQQDIALEQNLRKVGTRMKVLVERREGADAVGRTEFDSPEVDNEVIIKDCATAPGNFTMVEIEEALPFELIGKEIKS